MTTTATPPMLSLRRGPSRLTRQRQATGLIMTLPLIVLVGVFFVLPLLLMVWMSLNRWPLFGASAPNGVANYAAVLDPLFLKAVFFTVEYTLISTVALGVVALGLALMVQGSGRWIGLLRTIFLLPAAVGFASTCYLFFAQFQLQDSSLNNLVRSLGLTSGTFEWLGTTGSALWSTVALVVWRFAGFYMLILLTGLQAIPGELYEAAEIDGARPLQVFRLITLPLLRPSLALMLVLAVSGSLLVFEPFYILTQGRPDNTTVSAVMVIYREAFILFDLGRAAALSVVVLVGVTLLNGAQLFSVRKADDR